MEGLLRKYKISKISDNVKLTEQELKICTFLDSCLIGLVKEDDGYCYCNVNGHAIFEFTKFNYLYVSSVHCWTFLEQLGLQYSDIQILTQSWVEDLYKLKVNTTEKSPYMFREMVEDLYKLKVNTFGF